MCFSVEHFTAKVAFNRKTWMQRAWHDVPSQGDCPCRSSYVGKDLKLTAIFHKAAGTVTYYLLKGCHDHALKQSSNTADPSRASAKGQACANNKEQGSVLVAIGPGSRNMYLPNSAWQTTPVILSRQQC